MKKLLILLLIAPVFGYGQSIYKGLEYGMSETDAKKEFKQNKSTYISVDTGNGFLYRIYQQNFIYDKNKLVGLLMTPKGAALGQSYDNCKSYLIHTRNFFESLGYETFIDNEWWNAPLNYTKSGSKWGLVLNKKDKSTIVQMYPIEISNNSYLVNLRIWHYDTWMDLYNKENEKQNLKVDNSGF